MKTSPDQYKPEQPDQLIGAPAESAAALLRHVLNLKHKAAPSLRMCFYGDPGCGKTAIADMIARALVANAIDIESVNGRNLTIDLVREWQQGAAYGSLFGGWKVKVINEADLIPAAAQDLMLSYLDELPPHTAILATSNATMETLSDRFATRLGPVKIDSPTDGQIESFLRRKWKLPKEAAAFIAQGCAGNVRDALLRAANFLIFGRLDARPAKPATPSVSLSGSEAARKAWETRRTREAANSNQN